jgi:hypothetical protein
LTADHAVLDEKAEKLRLEGNVRMIASNGDDVQADSVTVSTKEGDDSWEWIQGSGTMTTTKEMEKQLPSTEEKPKGGEKPPADKGKPPKK